MLIAKELYQAYYSNMSLQVSPPLVDVVVAARRERLVAVCGNPRMIFQWVPRKELESSLLPLWMECAAHHRERGRSQSTYLETVPNTVEDAIPLVDAARLIVGHITASVDSTPGTTDSARDDISERDVVRKIVLLESDKRNNSVPSSAVPHCLPSYGALLDEMIVDLLTAVDATQCKWITWASFTAYLIDTDNREERWTTSKHHLLKWRSRRGEAVESHHDHGLSDVEREMASVAVAKREKEGAAEDERRKEVVLLWDEDVHDTTQLSPQRQKRSQNSNGDDSLAERTTSSSVKEHPVDALGEDELLITLRRRNQMKSASMKDAATSTYGETKRSFAKKDKSVEDDGDDDGDDSLAAQQFPEKAAPMMTPFELGINVAGTTDVAVRLVEIGDTPFLACFTRAGKLYVIHRSTRRKELSVPTIVFESTPIAVTFARRHSFHKGVPGLGSFQSFLAVSTASFRLHIICCRLFEVRVVHEVKEGINALAYCSERNILYGGSNSGYICVWAVSDKGFVSMIAKWRIHKALVPITALSIASSGLRCCGGEDQQDTPSHAIDDQQSEQKENRLHDALFPDSNDMLLVGYADGSVVQVNVCSLFQMRDVVMVSYAWKSSSTPGAIDVEETIPSTTSVVDLSSAASKRAISDDRNILWFSIAETAQGGASTAQAQSSNNKLADGPIPSLTIHSIHFSVPLQQIVAINDEGTFALFPRDFPLAPAQRFVDTTRKSDERVVFAALDVDGTSIMIGDLSSNFYIVSLVSLSVTWKQLVHAAIVDGLALRGRAPVTHSKGLDSDNPIGYCGVVLRGGSSTGVDTVLYNTGDGCVVMVIDSVVAPSSGSLFTREPDDLLCCEPHPLNSDLLVVANPFQVCLYDVVASRRFVMHSLSTAEMLMHTAARRNVQRNHELRITAVAVSLSGHRVYVGGSNGSLSVARLDTGRAMRRFAMPPNSGDVLSLHCGGVGNLPRDDFLCITASMTLLVCNDSSKLYAEHEASPIQRMFRLGIAAPSAGLQPPPCEESLADAKEPPKVVAVASSLPLMPSLMYRLPGNMNSYLFVTATSRVSLAQWDVKNFEWQHIWVSEICPTTQVQLNHKQRLQKFGLPNAVESVQRRKKGKAKKSSAEHDDEKKREYIEDISEAFAVRGPRRQLQLSVGDSVFCVQPLLPYPLLCIGSLHGELLLIVTKPHVQYGECVARWKQRAAYVNSSSSSSVDKDISLFVKSSPPPDAATSSNSSDPSTALFTSSAAEPSVNSIGFVPPYTLVVCDTTGRSNVWDVSDVIIQLRMANIFDPSKTSLSGSAQRQLVHEVHRPAIVRFVASQASYDQVAAPSDTAKPKGRDANNHAVVISKFHFHFPFLFVAVDSKSRVLFLRLGGSDGSYIEQRPSFADAIAPLKGKGSQGQGASKSRKKLHRAVVALNVLWRLITKYRPSPPPTPNTGGGEGTSEQQQQQQLPSAALSNSFVSPLHPKMSFRSSSALLRKLSAIRTDISGERKSIARSSSSQEKGNTRPTAFTCSLSLVVGSGGADGELNHRCIALRGAVALSHLFDYYGYPLHEGKYLAWRSKQQSKELGGPTAKARQSVDAFIDSSSDEEGEVADDIPHENLSIVPKVEPFKTVATTLASVHPHSSSSSTPIAAAPVREISSHLLTVGGSTLKGIGGEPRTSQTPSVSQSDGSFVTFQPIADGITVSCIPHDTSERKRVERRRSDSGPNVGVNVTLGSEGSLQSGDSAALVCVSRVSLKSPFGGTPTLNQSVAKELRDGPLKQFTALSCGGVTLEDLNQDADMIRASKCFSFDPTTDPGYHTRKRQMAYVCMDKTKRSLLAASYAPRILKRDEKGDQQSLGVCSDVPPPASTLDTRKSWAPFSSLRDEVEAVIKSAKLNVPDDPPKPLFSTQRELSAKEKPSVLTDKPRPMSAALSRSHRSRTPMGGGARPASVDFPSPPERQKFGFVKLLRKQTTTATQEDTLWLVEDDS